MNVIKIIDVLHEKIDTATDPKDILYLTKAIERLNLGFVKLVPTYFDLLSENPQIGEVYFVNDEGKLYYNVGSVWVLITVTADISAWAWGLNTNGRLGNNSTSARSSPVSVVGGFSDWVHISAGNEHSVALRANGSAWAWGSNFNGRLGNSSTIDRSSPIPVVGGFSDWVQVSAGDRHSVAHRANGSAWAWGLNNNGRLGDGTITNRSSPVSVIGGFLDWVQISPGYAHTIALRANGSAWVWGGNSFGQLGDDSTTAKSSPVSVIGGFQDWVQISAGRYHSAALRANGSAWAWGSNSNGRLGDDTTIGRSSPVSVIGGLSDWVQISAGYAHTIALRANGSAWAWGYNIDGRLGDDTITAKSSPVSVVSGFSDWVQVSAGRYHSAALRADGSAWAWGNNGNGRLGDDTTIAKSSPVSVVGDFLDWVQVSAGGNFTIAIRTST
jgi:alpha-tubulin suppressor-like RCC1 family protein